MWSVCAVWVTSAVLRVLRWSAVLLQSNKHRHQPLGCIISDNITVGYFGEKRCTLVSAFLAFFFRRVICVVCVSCLGPISCVEGAAMECSAAAKQQTSRPTSRLYIG